MRLSASASQVSPAPTQTHNANDEKNNEQHEKFMGKTHDDDDNNAAELANVKPDDPAPATLPPDPEEEEGAMDSDDDVQQGEEEAFPRDGVSLQWLEMFVEMHKDESFSWTATEYHTVQHGGGGSEPICIKPSNLEQHRTQLKQASASGGGVQDISQST